MKEMKKMGNPKVLKCKCGGYPDFINVGDHRNLYICRCNRCGAEPKERENEIYVHP